MDDDVVSPDPFMGDRIDGFDGRCPDCGGDGWIEGPHGGLSVNITCANPTCGSRFNTSPVFTERISAPAPLRLEGYVPADEPPRRWPDAWPNDKPPDLFPPDFQPGANPRPFPEWDAETRRKRRRPLFTDPNEKPELTPLQEIEQMMRSMRRLGIWMIPLLAIMAGFMAYQQAWVSSVMLSGTCGWVGFSVGMMTARIAGLNKRPQ